MPQLSSRRAVYTGVFDPIHLGHLDIIQRASKIVDELIVGVGINPEKTPFFSIEERCSLIERVTTQYQNVTVRPFTGLAVRFVREMGALYTAFAAGSPSPLPELPLQYADFAVWQREWLSPAVVAGLLAYWRQRLAGAAALLDLPLDRNHCPRPHDVGRDQVHGPARVGGQPEDPAR